MKMVIPDAPWTRQPLAWLLGTLLLTILPLIYLAELPWWVVIFSLWAGWYRWSREKIGLGPPKAAVKFLLLGIGTIGVVLTGGTLLGLDESLAYLVVLVGFKILEMKTAREFSLAVFMGYFLVMAALLYSQSLLFCLYASGLILLYTAALVQFSLGLEKGFRPRLALSLATGMILKVAPVVVILFLIFPRTEGGFLLRMAATPQAVSGLSDSLQPGSLERIAASSEVAFRVEFPETGLPRTSEMYWRGPVLWEARGDGFEWVAGRLPGGSTAPLSGLEIEQRITLMPHGARWLFALDYPASRISRSSKVVGDFLVSERDVVRTRIYTVTSQPINEQATLPRFILEQSLQVPDEVSEEVRALAQSWAEASDSPREIVERALNFFSDRFRYTLSPGSVNTLERFLFQSRRGFCEHYAAAFATLMRLAGVPARVVTGYHGGNYNRYGDYLDVRQLDAHAWCEVWFEGEGWQRIDPTSVVEPLRVNEGMDAFLRSDRVGGLELSRLDGFFGEASPWRQRMLDVRMAWDTLNYRWDLWVMGFDPEIQQELWSNRGWLQAQSGAWWFGVIFGLLLSAAALWWIAPWRRSPATRLQRIYDHFQKRSAKAGYVRRPVEGEWSFGQRLTREMPAKSEALLQFTQLFCRAKYDPRSDPSEMQSSLRKQLRAIGKLPKKS